MIRHVYLMMLLACMVCLPIQQAYAVDIMHWERVPLKVELPVGTERVMVLDRNVRVGLPQVIADPKILRVQSAGGALYLKALEAFDTQRVQLQDVETQEVILIDLSAREGVSDEQIRVVFEANTGEKSSDADASKQTDSRQAAGTPLPVLMTRYAAQSLYAPERLIEPVPGVHRVPMRLPEQIPSLLPALPVSLMPIAAWKGSNGWIVTAVKVTNQDPQRRFSLDPRLLQGRLYSATFMHSTIGPQGSVEDTTTVFIVTRGQSLAKAVPLSRSHQPSGDTQVSGGDS